MNNISTTAAMLMIAASRTNTLTASTTITATIPATTMITQRDKEETISTDWISQGMCYV